MINCPVCNKDLKVITREDQEVDLCLKCGGIWFDEGELIRVVKSLLAKNIVTHQTVKEAYGNKIISSDKFDHIKRTCPRCNIKMNLYNYCYAANIFLDRCANCEGIWCDEGEMKAIAKYIKGNPEIDNRAKALITEVSVFRRGRGSGGNRGKGVACVVTLSYLGVGYFMGGLGGFLRILLFLIWPLAFIFFGNELGILTGVRFRLMGPVITRPTPGFFVVFMGWVLLFLPVCMAMIAIVTK